MARRSSLYIVAAGLRRSAAALSQLPPMRAVEHAIHQVDFTAGRHNSSFGGCYTSHAEAAAAAPKGRIGYDHEVMAGLFDPYGNDSINPMDSNDYAVLFWLREIICTARRVFDLGGCIGTAYYNYRQYLDYPPGLDWTVCDVPAIVQAGEAFAQRKSEAGLRFTTAQLEADGADILLAAGSLQYLQEGSLHRLVASLTTRPRHVLVQRTPLHPSRSFVTLQVMTLPDGPVFCPYTVAARQPFIDGMRSLGYDLVDTWAKPRELVVPLHPECQVPFYSGLYFRLASA